MNKGPFEFGTKPHQGKRKDLDEIKDLVVARKTNIEIMESRGGSAARYEKQITFLRFTYGSIFSDRQLQGIRVIVIWGPTGSGKTYAAVNYIAQGCDYYIVEAPARGTDKVWFDGYEMQKCLILDDFAGEFCNLNYLKRVLDKYKLKVEVKGSHVWACWTTVVITSNKPPIEWYQPSQFNHIAEEDINALKRRITEIRFQEERGLYKLDDFKGEKNSSQQFMEWDPLVIPATPPDKTPPKAVVAAPPAAAPATPSYHSDSENDEIITID